ncbi:uncharacterized protein LOC121728131 isoform X2 [Aricia agestis]|nr:uncharacterized protein LOC121728131 isoform X2 [Aricia agestis]
MERSKAMLDKICTMRTLVPEFFGEYDVKRDFPGLRDYFVTVLLPKPTADLCRVYVCKIYDNGSMKKHAMNALRYLTILADYVKLNDYLSKAIVIVDLMDANLSDLIGGIDVVDIKRHSSIIMDGFGMRPQKVYVLTASKLVCTLMTLMKSAVKQKVASRMEVVKSCEELHKHLPREILPMDYGGKEESIRDIQDLWLDALSEQEFLEYLREMNTAKTNEALRLRADFNQNYAGMPGTFKYLHID